MDIFWTVVFLALLLPGFVFAVVPVLPSVPYMFIVSIVFNLTVRHFDLREIIVLGVIAIFSVALDFFSGLLGARWGGASGRSLLIGTIGMAIGTIILPLFGGLLGLFIGILVSEILYSSTKNALKAASSSVAGSLIGMAGNLVLCVIFVISFLVFAI